MLNLETLVKLFNRTLPSNVALYTSEKREIQTFKFVVNDIKDAAEITVIGNTITLTPDYGVPSSFIYEGTDEELDALDEKIVKTTMQYLG